MTVLKLVLCTYLLVILNGLAFSQVSVVGAIPSGVQRDFDTKKYGVLNKNGDIIVPFIYESLPNSVSEKMIAKKNGKFGIIDHKNNILVDFTYDALYAYPPYFMAYTNYTDDLSYCSVIDSHFVTLITETAKYNKIEAIGTSFERTTEYYKRNIAFKAYNFEKHKVELLYKNGKVFKSFPYDEIKGMDNYLKVTINRPNEWDNLEGLVDWNGKVLLKPIYRYISWVSKGNVCLYIDEDNTNAHIIDLKSKKVKSNKYPRVNEPVEDGCYIIGKYSNGIDYSGIINSQFEEIYPMCNCTIYYKEQEKLFSITDNVTKKVDFLPCN